MKTLELEQIMLALRRMNALSLDCSGLLLELSSPSLQQLEHLQTLLLSLQLAVEQCQVLVWRLSRPSLESTAEESSGGSTTS